MHYNPFQSKIPKPFQIWGAIAATTLAAGYVLSLRSRILDYIRFENDNLETAIRRFEYPEKGLTIDLIGTIHVADEEYFDAAKEHMDGLDKILYESVRPEDKHQSDHLTLLRRMYRIMANELGCVSQMDAINYDALPEHWEHCDLTEKEIAGRGGLLYRQAFTTWKLYKTVIENISTELDILEKEAESIRAASGPMLASFRKYAGKGMLRTMSHPLLSKIMLLGSDVLLGRGVILKERNRVVCDRLKELTEEEDSMRIGVFYGAAHLPEIEDCLKELGYEHRATFWQAAWEIG